MSSYLLAKAVRTRTTTGNTRLLLLIMADAASESGHVSMTIEEMAARANAHRRTITRALEDMIRSGIITGGPDYCLILDDESLFEVQGVEFAEPDEGGETTAPAPLDVPKWQWTEMGFDTREGGFYAKRDGVVVPLPQVAEGPTSTDEAMRLRIEACDDALKRYHARQKAEIADGVKACVDAGGDDRTAVWVTSPDIPGMPPASTPVGALMRAAAVDPTPLEPLYWLRPGHNDDVAHIEKTLGMTWQEIAAFCADRRVQAGPIRRLIGLVPLVQRAQRAPGSIAR